MRNIFLTAACVVASVVLNAQIEQIDISTGVVNNSSVLINNGSGDDTWQVIRPPSNDQLFYPSGLGGTFAYYVSAWAAPTNCKWVTAYYTEAMNPFRNMHPAGVFEFQAPFTISTAPCAVGSAVLTFNAISADNSITGLKINGVPYTFTKSGFTTFATNVTITINTADLVQGQNILSVIVNNNPPVGDGYNWAALCVKGNITVVYKDADPIVPSFTLPEEYCAGQAITVTGSDGAGTSEYYLWEVNECDVAGNIVNQTPVYSFWFTNSPGTYTIPGSSTWTCGKYYRIKLAMSNSCTSWAEVTHVTYIRCKPTPTITSSDPGPLCYGESTTLTTNYTPSSSTSIYWSNSATTTSTTVTPPTSTNYSVTVTSKGCSASASYNVNVNYLSDPRFTIVATGASNSSYFTMTATPFVANPQPNGVWVYWEVVEVTSTGADIPNTRVYNPDCWFRTNGINSFWNYDYNTNYNNTNANNGYASGANFPCSSTVGHFESGHYYRISRATAIANSCPDMVFASQVVTVCTSCRLASGEQQGLVTISSDEYTSSTLPSNLAHLREAASRNFAQAASFEAYPNPSNGVFNLKFSEASAQQIFVYDLMGNLVLEQQVSDQITTIDLSNQPKGVYICKAVSATGTETRRLVVQ
jgi:hypothetical protein